MCGNLYILLVLVVVAYATFRIVYNLLRNKVQLAKSVSRGLLCFVFLGIYAASFPHHTTIVPYRVLKLQHSA